MKKLLLLVLLLLVGCNQTDTLNREHPPGDPPKIGCDIVEAPNRFEYPMFVRNMTKISPKEEFCGTKENSYELDYLSFFAQDPILLNVHIDPNEAEAVVFLELWVWDPITEEFQSVHTFVSGNEGEMDIIQWPIDQGFFMLTHQYVNGTIIDYSFEFWSDV